MPSYVKFETSKELVPQILDMLSVAKDNGKLKKGVNETTKSIERKQAQFVVIAEDVSPEEVVVHLPMLCEENGIPYAYIPTKVDLGKSVGIEVGTSSIAVENAGGAGEKLQDILKRLPKQASAHKTEKLAHPQAHPKQAEKPAPAAHAKPVDKPVHHVEKPAVHPAAEKHKAKK